MRYLKTNTATVITVGPFLDKTDGITPETGITVTGVHLTLMVDNAGSPTLALDADATASGGNNDMVHITNDDAGYYSLELTAANLNYLGGALLSLNVVGTACPVFHEFTILPAQVYDSLVAGTDLLDANASQLGGTNQTGRDVGASVLLAAGQKVDVDTIKTNPVVNGGTITFPSNATVASTTGAVGSVTGAVGSVTGAVGSVTGAVGSVTGAVGSVTGAVGSVAAGGITAASFGANAIDAAALATDAAQEIRDTVWAKVVAQLTGDPGATPTALQAVALPYMGLRNLRTTTATQDTIANDAGATILTADVADDGTTFSKAKYA